MSGISHVTNPVEPAGDQLLGIDAAKLSSGDDDRDYWEQLINEEVAARFLGFGVRALQGWRYRGGGPRYCRVSTPTSLSMFPNRADAGNDNATRFESPPDRFFITFYSQMVPQLSIHPVCHVVATTRFQIP